MINTCYSNSTFYESVFKIYYVHTILILIGLLVNTLFRLLVQIHVNIKMLAFFVRIYLLNPFL